MKILALVVVLMSGEVRIGYYPATVPPFDENGQQVQQAVVTGEAVQAAVTHCVDKAKKASRLPEVQTASCQWIVPQPQENSEQKVM